MPIYEYQCDQCQHVTEVLRRMSDADQTQVCESCGSTKTHRQHSVFAAQGGGTNQELPMGGMPGACGMNPATGGCGMCGKGVPHSH